MISRPEMGEGVCEQYQATVRGNQANMWETTQSVKPSP